MLLSFVLFLVLLAFARPVLSQRLGDVESRGTEIVVAIDLSASMKATDLKPSRAAKSRELLHELVASSKQDKFAILGFTSSAIILSTMTDDKTLLFELLERLNRDYVVSKSTKLKSVFELANQLSLLDKKQLVIFSDGSEGDLEAEVAFANEHGMRVYTVGVATTSGSSLYDDSGELLTNEKGDIVITALNDELKALAERTGGKFYSYDKSMADIISDIHEDAQMQTGHSKELTYIELFYIPLIIAVILFMLASTSILAPYVAVFLLTVPLSETKAGVLDFFSIIKGEKRFEHKDFESSAKAFASLGDKNWQAMYNTGTAYYQAKLYAKARRYFRRIKTTDPKLKATLLYNIGNTYAYEFYVKKAVQSYRESLLLEFRQETLENLLYVSLLEERTEMFSGRKKSSQKDDTQEESMSSAGQGQAKSKQQGSSSSAGGGATKKQENQKPLKKLRKAKVGLSSEQYETINKGKYNEKNPW
jgi:Ca-activated chloride channel family protein